MKITTTSARNVALKSIFVDLAEWQASHGRGPRGFGSWVFSFGDEDADQMYWAPVGTYAESVRLAKSVARWLGRDYVKVMP